MTFSGENGPLRRLALKLLSVPIQIKVMGVGALVACLFGAILISIMRVHLAAAYEDSLVAESSSLARLAAMRVEGKLVTRDVLGIHDTLASLVTANPDIAYVVVTDFDGVVAASEGSTVPPAVEGGSIPHGTGDRARRLMEEGEIYETTVPALEGHAGMVRLGLTDRRLRTGLASQAKWLFLAFGVCVLAGQILAAVLARILTRPLHHLVMVTGQVGEGDLDARAVRFHGDEIGELAVAFNQTIERLAEQRKELQAREVERVQLLDKVICSQEEERARVARELHDELGQSLLALLLQIRASNSDEAHCVMHRVELEDSLGRIIEEVRRLAWSLRPSILDDHGLESALTRHVESVQGLSGLNVDFQFVCLDGAESRFEPRVELVLYRVAQEALTNVLRHSEAKSASVLVCRNPDEVRLLVEDDGKGFDASASARASTGRLGLVGMRERVTLVGGQLAVESEPGHGTVVRALIPTTEKTG